VKLTEFPSTLQRVVKLHNAGKKIQQTNQFIFSMLNIKPYRVKSMGILSGLLCLGAKSRERVKRLGFPKPGKRVDVL
jgi:hypothetical protein